MNSKRLLKSFEHTKEIIFSQAIKIENKELYFLFEIDILSMNPEIANELLNKIKIDLNINKIKPEIVNASIRPIAYMINEKIVNTEEYYLVPFNEENKKYINNHLNEIIKKFVKAKEI